MLLVVGRVTQGGGQSCRSGFENRAWFWMCLDEMLVAHTRKHPHVYTSRAQGKEGGATTIKSVAIVYRYTCTLVACQL